MKNATADCRYFILWQGIICTYTLYIIDTYIFQFLNIHIKTSFINLKKRKTLLESDYYEYYKYYNACGITFFLIVYDI